MPKMQSAADSVSRARTMKLRVAPSDFSTPISRVRSMTVVYMVRKMTRRPMAIASEIMAWMKVSRPGMFVDVMSDKKSFNGRTRSEEHTSELQSPDHLV